MKKHIVCFGDSNTHGYCADPNDTADRTDRFNEDERWTCLLQKALGEEYLVLEEGLSGRTTVFSDPLHECMSGLDVIYSTLMSHEPVDLLIIMLGTNDTKERFNASPACIGKPNLLIVAPPHIGAGHNDPAMGASCHAASMGVAEEYRKKCAAHGWAFFDAEGVAEFNTVDYMHLSRRGHRQLADALAPRVRDLMT